MTDVFVFVSIYNPCQKKLERLLIAACKKKQSKSKTTLPKYHCRFKNFDPLPPYNVDLCSQYFHTASSEKGLSSASKQPN